MKWFKRFTIVNMVLLIGLTSSCTKMLNMSKKDYTRYLEEGPYDAIIVPGVPFEGENWSKTMKMRVYWSWYLYNQGIAKNVIYSGSAVYSPYYESEIMAEYALALGIPAENIFLESHAEHSTENLYYSEKMAKQLGFEKVALATDPFQNSMLKRFRSRFYTHVAILPVQFEILGKMDMEDPTIPHETLLVSNFTSIVDRESLFRRLAGTMGKHVEDSIQTAPIN